MTEKKKRKLVKKRPVVNDDTGFLVVGIDISKNRAAFVACTDTAVLVTKHDLRTPLDFSRKTEEFVKMVRGKWGRNPDVTYIEDAVVGRGGARPTIDQAIRMGAAIAAMQHWHWIVSLVNVQTWKKQVVGNGNAKKEQVLEFAQKQKLTGAHIGTDQDLADASCIAMYARLVLDKKVVVEEGTVAP